MPPEAPTAEPVVVTAIHAVRRPKPPAPRKPATAPEPDADMSSELAAAVPEPEPEVQPPDVPSDTPASETASVVDPPRAHTSNEPPRYPRASRRRGEQGVVLLWVLVDERGAVREAAVAESSGYSRLDAAALSAVRAWTFDPAWRDGRPVPHPMEIPVRFQLQD